MLCYELGKQIITKNWSIEDTKTLRAEILSLPH